MIISAESHLLLHRLHQLEHDRHRSHLTAIRDTHRTARVVPATTSAASTPWQRLLRSGRRRSARGPTTPNGSNTAAPAPTIATPPPHEASSPGTVADRCSNRTPAPAATPC